VPRISKVSPVKTPVGEQVRIGIVGVARRVEHVEPQTFDLDPVAFGDPHRDDIGMGLFAHHRDAMGAVTQRPKPGRGIRWEDSAQNRSALIGGKSVGDRWEKMVGNIPHTP
jgi:hypothetical protein